MKDTALLFVITLYNQWTLETLEVLSSFFFPSQNRIILYFDLLFFPLR